MMTLGDYLNSRIDELRAERKEMFTLGLDRRRIDARIQELKRQLDSHRGVGA